MHTVPFVADNRAKRISGRHTSVGAVAALLSSQAGDPRAATGDTTIQGQATKRPTPMLRVSPSPAREPTRRAGRHRPTNKPDTEPMLRHRLIPRASPATPKHR